MSLRRARGHHGELGSLDDFVSVRTKLLRSDDLREGIMSNTNKASIFSWGERVECAAAFWVYGSEEAMIGDRL